MFDLLLLKTKKYFFLSLFGLFLATTWAQELSVSSSGEGVGSGGGVSYSVGQTFYIVNTGSTGSESQGMQQPYEISVVFSLNEVSNSSDETSVSGLYVPASPTLLWAASSLPYAERT